MEFIKCVHGLLRWERPAVDDNGFRKGQFSRQLAAACLGEPPNAVSYFGTRVHEVRCHVIN